jgi:hypothetical protein
MLHVDAGALRLWKSIARWLSRFPDRVSAAIDEERRSVKGIHDKPAQWVRCLTPLEHAWVRYGLLVFDAKHAFLDAAQRVS